MAGAYSVNMTATAVVETAVPLQRAAMVGVNSHGYVCAVRPPYAAVRRWDSQKLDDRVKLVVAHHRYLAGPGTTDDSYPTAESVAAAGL